MNTRTLRLTDGKAAAAVVSLLLVLIVWVPPALAKALPVDTRILTGKLDNGVTWMYREHANPPGKMALMIHVDAGSLNETDQQRGLAHFMEHMVFNGTEHFPPGKLIPFFESIGISYVIKTFFCFKGK